MFSPELLLLSADGRLILVYTIPISAPSNEGTLKQQEEEDQRLPEGKKLELRRVETEEESSHRRGQHQHQQPQKQHPHREARVVFEELCAPDVAHPSFFLDASRFVHQHVGRV